MSGNNNYGLAKEIARQFPSARFFSRTNGNYDFLDPIIRAKFAQESLACDVYICCSSLSDFAQSLLLKEVISVWQGQGKAGSMIVIGSVLGEFAESRSDTYSKEKQSLRALCREVSLKMAYESPSRSSKFKLTYLSPGYLDTPGEFLETKKNISCEYICKTIQWILSQPRSINIGELALDPIQ